MKLILLCILLLFSSIAYAADWTPAQTSLLVGAETALFLDYMQTIDIASHPRLHETNVIMGKHPGRGTINTYFLASGLITAGLAYTLPTPYSELFLSGVIALEVIVIQHNKSLGLRFNF